MTPLILLPILFLCGGLKLIAPRLRSLLKNATAAVEKKPSKNTTAKSQPAANSVDLGTVFATFDGDGDGFINTKELHDSLQRLGLSATAEDVRGMVERADANGDGLIDVEEFRELHDSLHKDEEVSLREAFHVFDGNGDGLITVEELRHVLTTMGLKQGGAMADGDCRDMIRKVDMDGDGMVNFEEFRKMMMVKGGELF